MSCPTKLLLDAARRVLTCLHHHQHIGLRYELCPRGVNAECAVTPIPLGRHVIPRQAGSSRLDVPLFAGPPKHREASLSFPAKPRPLRRPKPRKKLSTCERFSRNSDVRKRRRLCCRWTTTAPSI
eukprot:6181418-Pleurochrysis_carterae.AAC.5